MYLKDQRHDEHLRLNKKDATNQIPEEKFEALREVFGPHTVFTPEWINEQLFELEKLVILTYNFTYGMADAEDIVSYVRSKCE